MPIHFHDIDITPELEGMRSALIVPCNMCPAVTVALREQRPFMNIFRSLTRSDPFEEYLSAMQSMLQGHGIKADVFNNRLYHHWFMCMWSSSRHKKLLERARKYNAVIALGCESAYRTVRDSLRSADCRVIEGMETSGIMNAKLRLHASGNISFHDFKVVPFSRDKAEKYSTDVTSDVQTETTYAAQGV